MNQQSYSIAEASEILGISKQSLRLWLQSGHCLFGDAFHGKGKNFIYYINKQRMDDYIKNKL